MSTRRRQSGSSLPGCVIWVPLGLLVIGGIWLTSKIGLANVMAVIFVLIMLVWVFRRELTNLREY